VQACICISQCRLIDHDTIIAFSLLVMNKKNLIFSLQPSVIVRRKLRGIASCSKNIVPLCPPCVPLHNSRCPLKLHLLYIFISDNVCQVISVNLIKHYKLISFLINLCILSMVTIWTVAIIV
jgi:hypothetical protein